MLCLMLQEGDPLSSPHAGSERQVQKQALR